MPFLFVALYGFLSGLFDVLPVSSLAHQSILQSVFGIDASLHLYKFLAHLSSLSALILAMLPSITALIREQKIQSLPRRRMQPERKFTYELRFVKTALIASVLFSSLVLLVGRISYNYLLTGILCIFNGVIVLLPEYLPSANKSAKHLSGFDAIIFGLLSSIGSFPGLSRIGAMQCYASLRGAEHSKSCNWALLITIPVLAVHLIFDLVGIVTAGIGVVSFLTILSFLFGALLSFAGTFCGITLIRFLSARVGFAGFGYYSIGVGLLTFFLYLTV